MSQFCETLGAPTIAAAIRCRFAERLGRPGATPVAIPQNVELFERSVRQAGALWMPDREVGVQIPSNAGALRPRIYRPLRSAGSLRTLLPTGFHYAYVTRDTCGW